MSRLALVVATLMAALAVTVSSSSAPPAPSTPGSLADVFALTGGAVRDTNGDGLADSITARVVVPLHPTADDTEAATNIAGRLGYETTAATLSFVVTDARATEAMGAPLVFLVGRSNREVVRLADEGAIDLKSLAPGQGLIALVSDRGGHRRIVVAGGDEAGTLAAGIELAARLPRLWNMTGITLGQIEQHVVQFLTQAGVTPSAAQVRSLVIDAERRGIARVVVQATVPAASVPRAAAALKRLDEAHRRGAQERVLNFAEAANLQVEWNDPAAGLAPVTVRRSGLNGRTLTPPVDPDEFLPDPTPDRAPNAPDPRLAPAKPFDLTNPYSIDGWFGDAYADLIPDRTETTLVVGGGDEALGAAHIAARLGLETTGVSLPLTRRAEKVKEPGNEPSPILVGRDNALVQQLLKIGKTRLDDLASGEGEVHIVPRAFANATATVVAGRDTAGSLAAADYLARRLPYVWETTRGAANLDEVASEVTKFLGAKSAAGQAGQALHELQDVLQDLREKPLESVEASVYLEKADEGFERYLAGEIGNTLGAGVKVKVVSRAVTDPTPVFEEKTDFPWEVDEFWQRFRSDVLPKVKAGAAVSVEARLSEPESVRREVADRARGELLKAGATQASVSVLCAYKQGYSWITESVIPRLKGKGARRVAVHVRTYQPDLSKKFKFYTVPTRWTHELYPVDEILQRELAIPTGAFQIDQVDNASDVYDLEAFDGSGRRVLHEQFSPKFVEREYLDKFPGWSRVEVTTGWLTATVDGATVSDARILTDPERFWDYYQSKVLPRVYDQVMKVTGGKPTADKQPFHRDLDVEVWMSEPDARIGVDEELISSLEALHEDIYFVTLDFFGAMGRTLTRNRLQAPGKVFPIIHPSRTGQGASSRVFYAANAAPKARLDVVYKEKGIEKPVTVTRELGKIECSAPQVLRAIATVDHLRELDLQVEAKDDKEASRAADAIDGLVKLQAAGLYRANLSYEHLDRLAITILLKDARTRRTVVNTGMAVPSNVRRAGGPPPAGGLVKWDHIIGPDESESLVRALSAYPEIHSYKVGESYRGRDISAMEVMLPTPSELVSVAKATAFKPTLLLIGRQHANEVSSTSHILRLAEMLATVPEYKAALRKVNVVLCPVMNPDGAEMAYTLQKLTPTHMLHAGRYSALGMDITSRAVGLLPEAEVEGKLWRQWLPDIYLNPHGYPSHEWVQPFSGYVAPGFRAYWSSRGWYTMLSGLRDPRYPEHAEAVTALREAIVREINANADVKAMSMRHQARYRRWAYGFGPHVYGVEVYKDTMIYYSDPETGEPRGSRRAAPASSTGGTKRASIGAWPQVTFMSGMTEAPDETAQGDWLSLVSKAGFSFLRAHLLYLEEGRYRVERIEEGGARDGSVLTMLRVRPVMPAKPKM